MLNGVVIVCDLSMKTMAGIVADVFVVKTGNNLIITGYYDEDFDSITLVIKDEELTEK